MKNLVKVFTGFNIALALFYAYRFLFFDTQTSAEKMFTLFALVMVSITSTIFLSLHDEII